MSSIPEEKETLYSMKFEKRRRSKPQRKSIDTEKATLLEL